MTVSITTLCIKYHYAEGCYSECHVCYSTFIVVLNVVKMSITVMLNVVMLGVVMLSGMVINEQ